MENRTVKELKALCDQKKIAYKAKDNKTTLIALLQGSEQAAMAPAKAAAKTAPKPSGER